MKFKLLVLIIIFCISGTIFCMQSLAAGFVPENAESTKYLNPSVSAYKERGRYGLYNSKGYVTQPIYDYIDSFTADYDYIKFSQYGRYGVMDRYGKIMISPQYDDIELEYNSTFSVKKYGSWGIVDKYGRIIINPDYDSAGYFYEDLYKLSKRGKYGIANKYGKLVLALEWDDVAFLDSEMYKVTRNGRFGAVSANGQTVLQPQYGYVAYLRGALSVCRNSSSACGIINSKGNIVLPLNYSGIIENLSNGYFTVNCNGKYGVIDIDGKTILDCKYTKIEKADDNVIYFKNNKLFGLADKKDGRIIASPVYAKIQALDMKGYYKVKKDGKWGVVNHDGKLVYSTQYGPLKINSVVKNIQTNSKFVELYKYNSYYSSLMNLKFLLPTGGSVANDFRNIFMAANKYTDIKNLAVDLMRKYDVDNSYHYNY